MSATKLDGSGWGALWSACARSELSRPRRSRSGLTSYRKKAFPLARTTLTKSWAPPVRRVSKSLDRYHTLFGGTHTPPATIDQIYKQPLGRSHYKHRPGSKMGSGHCVFPAKHSHNDPLSTTPDRANQVAHAWLTIVRFLQLWLHMTGCGYNLPGHSYNLHLIDDPDPGGTSSVPPYPVPS